MVTSTSVIVPVHWEFATLGYGEATDLSGRVMAARLTGSTMGPASNASPDPLVTKPDELEDRSTTPNARPTNIEPTRTADQTRADRAYIGRPPFLRPTGGVSPGPV